MNEMQPIPPDSDGNIGRDGKGKFSKGNRFSKGNPLSQKVNKLRSTLLAAVSTSDLKAVIQTLVLQAKGGDVQASKVLLDRLLGSPNVELTATVEHSGMVSVNALRKELMMDKDYCEYLRQQAAGEDTYPDTPLAIALDAE